MCKQEYRPFLILALVASLVGIFCSVPRKSFAKRETVYANYKYVMGDNDTKSDAKRLCFLEAKRRCLEKVGSYVESLTEVKEYKLTKDEIRSYTSAIVKVEVVSEEITFEGESVVIYTRVKAEIDADHTRKELQRISKDKALQARINEQERQIESLEGKIRTLQAKLDSSSYEKSFQLREQRDQTFDDLYVENELMRNILLAKRARDAKRPNLVAERTKNRRLVLKYVEIGMTVDETAGVIKELADFPLFVETKDKNHVWNYCWDDMYFVFEWDKYLNVSVLKEIRYRCKMHFSGGPPGMGITTPVPYLKDKDFNILDFDFDQFERKKAKYPLERNVLDLFDKRYSTYERTINACPDDVRSYIWGEE